MGTTDEQRKTEKKSVMSNTANQQPTNTTKGKVITN